MKQRKPQQHRLFKAAIAVRKNAYAPYSKFQVGAALLDNKGNIRTGCNFENASYGATICAERAAVASLVSMGGKKFHEIVIVTATPHGVPPCGMCRQVLAEFAADQNKAKIHIANLKGVQKTYILSELFPEAFDKCELK